MRNIIAEYSVAQRTVTEQSGSFDSTVTVTLVRTGVDRRFESAGQITLTIPSVDAVSLHDSFELVLQKK